MSADVVRDVLLQEAEALSTLAARVGKDVEVAVQWILDCNGRVATCGVGKSGHIARKTAGTLASTGTPSFFLHAGEAVHGDLGMLTRDDVVVLYSHSGETDELVRLFPAIKAIGARTLLITGRPDSSAGRQADAVVSTHVDREACPENLAPTTSTTAMLALSDAIAIAVMTRRGFSRSDFARFHPSGALGKRLLLRVTDVMRTGADSAVVAPSDTVVEVLRAITSARAGAACVVGTDGRLVGLVADGDIRRHLVQSENPFDATAETIMTVNPSTLPANLLAFEALEVFQNLPAKVGEMPVLDENRPVGMLVLKDLLRSGIV